MLDWTNRLYNEKRFFSFNLTSLSDFFQIQPLMMGCICVFTGVRVLHDRCFCWCLFSPRVHLYVLGQVLLCVWLIMPFVLSGCVCPHWEMQVQGHTCCRAIFVCPCSEFIYFIYFLPNWLHLNGTHTHSDLLKHVHICPCWLCKWCKHILWLS